MSNHSLFAFLFVICSFSSEAQQFQWNSGGASAGLSIQFGTTINRIGIFAKGYHIYKDFQFNADVRWHFNQSGFGPDLKGHEFVYKIGAVWAWGDMDDFKNPFFSPIGNQLGKQRSIGYSFNQYFDQIGTNQKTGFLSLQLNRWNFILENDAFAGAPADKFRTAGALLQYRLDENTVVALTSILWTGDPFTDFIDTKTEDKNYPARYGYRDMSSATHGSFSNGVLALQIKTITPFQQELKYEVGVDSEYLRHLFQNKVIHDLYILPSAINPMKHPHIPMVGADGFQYLFREGEKVKPPSFYAQFGWNATMFY